MGDTLLEPFEGVTLEQWAEINARLVSGTPVEEAIKAIGADMPKWDRVNNEWMTRMSNDTSFTITKIYADAFNKKATGNLGEGSQVSEETYPFEKWIELLAAQDVFSKQGRDAQDVLKDFGLTVADYTNISSFWSEKLLSDASLPGKMQELLKEYTAKYEGTAGRSDANADIEF